LFQTLGVSIQRGRGFLDTDREDAPAVVVVSEAVARRYWPGEDPIGKRLRLSGQEPEWRTVIGVADEVRFRRLREPTPTIYLPWRQFMTFGTYAVRTQGELGSVLPQVRLVVRELDPRIDVWNAGSMDEYLAAPLARPRLSSLLLSGFGLVALLMAAIGLYGVMAASVRERTHDIGVRMALGAMPEQVRREVLGSALLVTTAGAIVGLAGALLGSRVLTSLLFEISPTDPPTLIGVTFLLLFVELVAAYLPARSATKVSPMRALQTE
jgi:putative ABC transport system permease protein